MYEKSSNHIFKDNSDLMTMKIHETGKMCTFIKTFYLLNPVPTFFPVSITTTNSICHVFNSCLNVFLFYNSYPLYKLGCNKHAAGKVT